MSDLLKKGCQLCLHIKSMSDYLFRQKVRDKKIITWKLKKKKKDAGLSRAWAQLRLWLGWARTEGAQAQVGWVGFFEPDLSSTPNTRHFHFEITRQKYSGQRHKICEMSYFKCYFTIWEFLAGLFGDIIHATNFMALEVNISI